MTDPPRLPSDGVLRLRPLMPDDAAAQVDGEDDHMVRWLSGGRSTREQQRAYLASAARAWSQRQRAFDLGIARVDGGTLIGVVGIQSDKSYLEPGDVNLTYGLYAPWRGQGLATRAVALAIDVAIKRFDPERLVIRVDPANEPSAAVAQRLGFCYWCNTTDEDDGEGEIDWYVRSPEPGGGNRRPALE